MVAASLAAPNFLLKIIPHIDGTPRICDRPGRARSSPSRMAAVAELPVLEVASGPHVVADMTLRLGKVAFGYPQ